MPALTDLIGREVIAADGARVGRLADLAVRPEGDQPAVTHLVVRTGRRAQRLVPAELVAAVEPDRVRLGVAAGALPAEELLPGELLLVRRLLDAQVVDAAGKRLARVADLELAQDGAALRVAAVDVGVAPLLRRLGLRRLAERARTESVDWRHLRLATERGRALELGRPILRRRPKAHHRRWPIRLIRRRAPS